MSTASVPKTMVERFRLVLVTAVSVIAATLFGTVLMALFGLIWRATNGLEGKPWSQIGVTAALGVVSVVVWRWAVGSPGRRKGPLVHISWSGKKKIDIPPPSDDEVPGPPWIDLDERDPRALKMQFNDALMDERFDDAERILAMMRELGGEEQWCQDSEFLLDQKRRRA